MGAIVSPAPEISRIRWVRCVGRPKKAKRVVMIPLGDRRAANPTYIMVAELDNGTFACSRDLSRFAYGTGNWPWMRDVLKALVRIGAVPQSAVDAHNKVAEERYERERRKRLSHEFREIAADFGIKVSARELRKLGAEA